MKSTAPLAGVAPRLAAPQAALRPLTRRRQGGARRGSLLLLMPVLLVALLTIAVFAVDWGRVQLAKAELQTAADAAAVYGARGANDGTAVSRAQQAASENTVLGQPLALAAGDVETGRWNTTTLAFTPTGGGSPNAVRVTARRSIALFFGAFVGRDELELRAVAVATAPAASGYAVAGRDFVKLNSDTLVDAYDSSAGAYGGANRFGDADLASNGDIEVISNSYLYGDAWYRPGRSVTVSGGSSIVAPGQKQLLSTPLSYPAAALPASYVNRGSFSQDGGTLTLNAGNYRYTDLVLNSGARLLVHGEVTIYVTSKFEVNSISTAVGQPPSQLKIVGLGSALISVNSNSSLAAQIYAPGGEVKINSGSQLYGSAVGKSVLINSDSQVHYDRSLATGSTARGRLVQ